MSKQDKVAPRTPADLERKYGKNFAEILGVATDARDIAEEVAKETEEIKLQVNNGVSAQFLLTIKEDGTKTYSLINGSATKIHFESDSFSVDSTHFKLQEDGTVTIKKGDIGGCSFDGEGNLKVPVKLLSGTISANQINADGIIAKDVDLTGTITATEGTFGNSHITSSGEIFHVPYEGIYFGSDSNDTFFGTTNHNGYRAVLGLGMLGGAATADSCILLTNKDIQFGGNFNPITWAELRETVQRLAVLYNSHRDWFT